MTICDLHASGRVELYVYGELDLVAHEQMERHLPACSECRRALEDLRTIRVALSTRPEISAPAGADWGPFMARLDDAVRRERRAAAIDDAGGLSSPAGATSTGGWKISRERSVVGYLAMAALVALVTISVLFALRTRDQNEGRTAGAVAEGAVTADGAASRASETHAAFVTLSEQHFERSKLVVLGLATKDPSDAAGSDWQYERDLAGTLLNDTRLYRLAAEERGLTSLARVMQDLELVLLQAAMSDTPDASSLERLQRVIRKRDLVTKIGVVTTIAGI